MNSIIYLLQVTACTAVFYLFYYLFLNRLTFFVTNRWYLLVTLILSFAIPLIKITVNQPHVYTGVVQQVVYNYSPEQFTPVATQPQVIKAEPIQWGMILKYTYLAAVLALTVHLFITLITFFKRLKGKRVTKMGKVNILSSNEKITNGSFLNYSFLNDEELSADERQQIIAHEMLHVKLYHSVDRIIVKLAQIILWFNPFIYLYTRSVEENHEFEVDRAVARDTDKHNYANLLVHLSVAGQGMLYHNFSKVPLKKRITMLFNQPSNNIKKITYILIVPVVLISCLAFAGLKTNSHDKKAKTHIQTKQSKNQKLIATVVAVKKASGKTDDYSKGGEKIYEPNILKDADVKDIIQPLFFKRTHFQKSDGTRHDEVTFTLSNGTGGSANLGVEDTVGAFVDGEFYNEAALMKLSSEKTSQLVFDTNREHFNRAKLPKTGDYAIPFMFKTKDAIGNDQTPAQPRKSMVVDTVKKAGGNGATLAGYEKTADYKLKKRLTYEVKNKVLEFKVKEILKEKATGKIIGYLISRTNNDYMLVGFYSYQKSANLPIKVGDEITVGVRTSGFTKGKPVLIWPEYVAKHDVKIFQAPVMNKSTATDTSASKSKAAKNVVSKVISDNNFDVFKNVNVMSSNRAVGGNNQLEFFGNVQLLYKGTKYHADYARLDTKLQQVQLNGFYTGDSKPDSDYRKNHTILKVDSY
jgi:hypothetical protein